MLKSNIVDSQVLLQLPDKETPYRLERQEDNTDNEWLVLTDSGFASVEDPLPPEEPITPPVEPCSHEFQYIACCENGHRQKCTICNETTEMEPHDYGDGEEFCKVCGFVNPDYTPEPVLVADALVFNKNAYFDIPYYANNNTRVVADCEIQYSDLSNINMMFGSRSSVALEPANTFIFVSQTSDDKMRTDYGLSGNKLLDRDYLPYNTRGIVDKNKNKTFINEVEVASHNAGSLFTSPNIFRIGNFIGASFNVSYSFKGKIYSFKIYDNDNLLFDLIPIAEGQTINDQTATANGFYDKVNDTIYYSMTGTAPEAEVHYENPTTDGFILEGGEQEESGVDLGGDTGDDNEVIEEPNKEIQITAKKVFDIFLDTYTVEGKRRYRARHYNDLEAEWLYTEWLFDGSSDEPPIKPPESSTSTYDDTPVIIPESAMKRILADLGAPILNAEEDLLITDEMVKELFVAPALQMYFTYWPLKLKQEILINGQVDIPFPNNQVFGVSQARVALLASAASYGKNPFINEVIRRQTSSYSYGRTRDNRDPYITPGTLIKEQTEQLSYITLRKAGNFNVDQIGRRLWGFSNVAGNLVIDWAMWSKNWNDIRFEHIEDVIKVCKMYALEFIGGIRQQSDPNTGVTADGSSFLEKAEKIKEEIIQNRWRGRQAIVVLR